MTPKDKGMLRELLHEYGASVLIRMLAKEAYGPMAGQFLGELAAELAPDCPTLVTSWLRPMWLFELHEYGAPNGDPGDPERCRA